LEVKAVTERHIRFQAGLLVDPFLINLFAAIYIDIPRRRQAFMVGFELAFVVVFPPADQPPEIFIVVHSADRESVGPWRDISRSRLASCVGAEGNTHRHEKKAQANEPFPTPNLSPVRSLHKRKERKNPLI
jgi:hypothetical protein